MAYAPVSKTVPQYHVSGSPASGYYLKGYDVGTTTAKTMATDAAAGTTLAKCQLNAQGYPINGSSAVFIPHFNGNFKLALYANATDADNNTTANATWIVDAIQGDLVANTIHYELGTQAAAASHPGISTGHLIETNYYDTSRVAGSGSAVQFTGTTTAGNAGIWGHTDGYFYDADGRQFEIVSRITPEQFGATGLGVADDTSACQAAIAAALLKTSPFIEVPNDYSVSGLTCASTLSLDGLGTGTLIHRASSSADMLAFTSGSAYIRGLNFNGNNANVSARVDTLSFAGTDIRVADCSFVSTVSYGIEVNDAQNVHIQGSLFTSIGPHSGVTGETAGAVSINESTNVARCLIWGNSFINSAPVSNTLAPSAITVSGAEGAIENCIIGNNTITGFGTSTGLNPEAAIEVYSPCDRCVITGNVIEQYYWTGIRVNDSNECIISDNVVAYAGYDFGAGVYSIGYIGQNHIAATRSEDCIISNNIIVNEYGDGIYGAGSATTKSGRINVSGNLVKEAKGTGILLSQLDSGANVDGNIVYNSDYAVQIDNSSCEVNISNLFADTITVTGINARTSVTGLSLNVTDCSFRDVTTYNVSARDVQDLKVTGCTMHGSIPSTNYIDLSNISGWIVVEENSWQTSDPVSITSSPRNVSLSEVGLTFDNTGAAGTIEFDLPDVTTLPTGWWCQFVVTVAQQFDVDPSSNDRIMPDTDADGDILRNSGTIGASVKLMHDHADGWRVVHSSGTWTDAN